MINQSPVKVIFIPKGHMNDKLSCFVFWESRLQILAQGPAFINEIGFHFLHFREEDSGSQCFN